MSLAPNSSAISTRAVLRAGVDDDELVDGVADGGEAAREHLLLVLDDHAQAQREALGRARGGGDALAARGQVAHRGADGGRERRRLQPCAAAAPGAGRGCSRRARDPGRGGGRPGRGARRRPARRARRRRRRRTFRKPGSRGSASSSSSARRATTAIAPARTGRSAGDSCRPTSSSAQARLVAAVDVLDLVGAREERGVARGRRARPARRAPRGGAWCLPRPAAWAGRRCQEQVLLRVPAQRPTRRRAMVGGPQRRGSGHARRGRQDPDAA